jgi:transcriptional regulator with XRE-family HTH domain
MDFQDLFRSMLLSRKLSQSQFARLSGLSQGFINQVAKGLRPPPLERLNKWAIILGLNTPERNDFFRAAFEFVAPGSTEDIYNYWGNMTFGDYLTACENLWEATSNKSRSLLDDGDRLGDLRTGNAPPTEAEAMVIADRLGLDSARRRCFLYLAKHPYPNSPGREQDPYSILEGKVALLEAQMAEAVKQRIFAERESAALRAQLRRLGAEPAPPPQAAPSTLSAELDALERDLEQAITAPRPPRVAPPATGSHR